VTVTVTAAVLPEGKTTDACTVPSPVSELESGTVTSAVGAGSGVSVNVAVPPASVVGPEMAETVIVGTNQPPLRVGYGAPQDTHAELQDVAPKHTHPVDGGVMAVDPFS
jgi:hypothetical protein